MIRHNPYANWLPFTDLEVRDKISNDFYHNLSNETLESFHDWLRSPTCSDEILSLLISEMEDSQTRQTLSKCIDEIDFSAHELSSDAHGLKGRVISSSMTIPTLRHLVFSVDRYMKHIDFNFSVIHDNTKYGEFFEFFLKNCAQMDSTAFVSTGGMPHNLNLNNYSGFETRDSKSLLGLQAADFVAAATSKIFNEINCDDDLSDRNSKSLFDMLLLESIGVIFGEIQPTFQQINASITFKTKILKKFGKINGKL